MNSPQNQISVVLGDEFDSALCSDLIDLLHSNFGISISPDWRMGGSQELIATTFLIGDSKVSLELETYIGLTISGPENIIRQIEKLVEERRRQRIL